MFRIFRVSGAALALFALASPTKAWAAEGPVGDHRDVMLLGETTAERPAGDPDATPRVPPSGAPTAATTKTTPESSPRRTERAPGFVFGSYGRVTAASDLRGGSGRPANIVAFGPRFDLPSYAELQLERHDDFDRDGEKFGTKIVSTIAFAAPLFHETGKFEAQVAVRNLYAETKGLFFKGFSVWVGSRMYRGDDVYLLNFWPLDNLNTVGGGLKLALDTSSEGATEIALHAGLGRALDPFSFQTRPSPLPSGFGAADVITLDRTRLVSSLKATHVHLLEPGKGGLKFSLYGELHKMANGVRVTESLREEELPPETGGLFGAQIGAFTGERDVFINLFVRMATGIAAYGDKTSPSALSIDKKAADAREAMVALSANYEKGPFGLLLGGYLRSFKDASGNPNSRETFREGAITVRPMFWFGERAGLAVEGSYQALATAGVDAVGKPERASVTRFLVMPFLTPSGRGSYTRPHYQLMYGYTSRSDGARARYPVDDKFASRGNEHFLGVGVEWWFQSSYR